MQLSVDISMYPLKDEFITPIDEFIAALNQHGQVEVKTNSISTQLFGDYDVVMALIQEAIKKSFETWGKCVFVTKFLLGDTRESSRYE